MISKLTTMQRTWTNTDTYGTVFEILKSWDPSTKLDSSKDQWKYNDTRCTYDEHVKRRLRASLHKQLKERLEIEKKKKMGNKACVCVWGNNGEMHRDLMYWHGCKSIGLYTGFQGSRTTEKLAVLVSAMIAAQMVSSVLFQACAFCAGLAAVSAPEPEVPLEPSMEGH